MDRRRISGELRRVERGLRRVAGTGRGTTAAAGRGDSPRLPGGRSPREAYRVHAGRRIGDRLHDIAARFSSSLILCVAMLAAPALAGERIVSTRVWPAQEYTRVTLESGKPIRHQYFFVKDPERLVVDLEGVELEAELKALPAKVLATDPY